MRRTTIYLEDPLHRALAIKAAETNTNISELVNRAARLSLMEDLADLAAFSQREKEPARPFENVLKKLKRGGLL